MMKQSEWKVGKMGLKFYFLPRKIKWILLHKIQKHQLLLDPNVNNKIVQFLEETIKENIFDLGTDKNFLNKTVQC